MISDRQLRIGVDTAEGLPCLLCGAEDTEYGAMWGMDSGEDPLDPADPGDRYVFCSFCTKCAERDDVLDAAEAHIRKHMEERS